MPRLKDVTSGKFINGGINPNQKKEYYIANRDKEIARAAQWYEENKSEVLNKRKQYQEDNKESIREKARWSHIRRTFGISKEQYEQLLEEQNHACFICLKPEEVFNRNLAVDHNHKTGEIRGLLCTHCNRNILGRNNDAELFRRATLYLEKPNTGWFVPPKKRKKRRKRSKPNV